MKQDNKPLVSIVCTSYNHEKYIKKCLDGFVMQQTNFLFEIIVHDDASTDSTQQIVKEYESRYPSLFNNIYQTENQFSNKEVNIWYDILFPMAKGDYIAICEGDDYWVNPFKLQKQIDFLEANPSYLFSMGRVDMLNEKNGEITRMTEHVDPHKNETFALKDYIKGPFSQTSSFVFRNSDKSFPNWVYNVHAGDQSLVVIKTGIAGKIKYHPDLFSIYRVNETSISFNLDLKKLKDRGDYFLKKINEFTEFKFNYIIQIRILINKFYYYSRSNSLIKRYLSLVVYRLLFNLVQKI